MTDKLRVGTWVSIDSGCPMRCKTSLDGVVALSFGDLVDLSFDDASLRELAELSAAAVREIDAGRPNSATETDDATASDQLASAGGQS